MLIAGDSDEVSAFRVRNRTFVDSLDVLEDTCNAVFVRDLPSVSPADAVIFYLGLRCVDDFREILLLCANGHGQGASALLRGLYERAVTCAHLHVNPEQAADFVDFDFVQRRKLMTALGMLDEDSDSTDGAVAELEADYQRVRDRFMVTDCSKCGTKRPSVSWSKMDFVSMAKKAGLIGKLVIPAYYMPLSHAHSTLRSITAKLQEDNGVLSLEDELDYRETDWTLRIAHLVLLQTINSQLEHFAFTDCDSAVADANAAFSRSWPVQPPRFVG